MMLTKCGLWPSRAVVPGRFVKNRTEARGLVPQKAGKRIAYNQSRIWVWFAVPNRWRTTVVGDTVGLLRHENQVKLKGIVTEE